MYSGVDATVGTGKLVGKGVYAARDFAEGELVVPYNFKALTQTEFNALPTAEREWTHSFYGKIYLFPEPARYVNHDDNPTTYPDLERQGDYALRPIKKGEPITINDRIELMHELETFLEAYEQAANSADFTNVAPFIATNATFWFTNGIFTGKAEIKKAFEDTWGSIKDETYTISNVQWVATNYWVSSCTYTFTSDGHVDGVSGRRTPAKARTYLLGWMVVGELCMST